MAYPQPGGAITTAPGATQWMPRPEVPGCPVGLEYLAMIDQILVHQAVELLEAFTGIECSNRFQVKNSAGQQIYYAAEESSFCCRQCCHSQREFTMHVADNFGQEVIRATREFKCCAGCCWCANFNCCAHEMAVEAPLGTVVGYVRQTCSFIKPRFEIQDADHEPILYIEGPICICECPCTEPDFKVYAMNDSIIGHVTKQWSGAVKEIFTEADNFGVQFPLDLDVKVKASLLVAVFLINMMYFEKKNNNNSNN